MSASLVFAFLFHRLVSLNAQIPTNGIAWEIGDYPLPQPRGYLVVAPAFSIDDNIAYIFDIHGDIPTVYKLDTTVNSPAWQELSVTIPMGPNNYAPWQRYHATQVGTKFYFYSMWTRKFDVFDTTTETFTDNSNFASSATYLSHDGSVVSDGSSIYLIGGQHGTYIGEYIQRYDIANNIWTVISTVSPTGEEMFGWSAAYYPVTNGIYVFGGYLGGANPDTFTEYYYFDLNTNLWGSALGTWPDSETYFTSVGSAIYVTAIDRFFVLASSGNEVKVYDPNTNTFSTTINTPSLCGDGTWASFMVLNGRVQRFGGTSNGNNCRTTPISMTTSAPTPSPVDSVDLIRFTQNSQYMEYDSSQGLVMRSNEDDLEFFLDSTFNKIEALNGATNCYSFQSLRDPEQYIGNNLANNDASVLLLVSDASNVDRVTWCEADALNGRGGKSWSPFGYSLYYMRQNSQTNAIFVTQNDNSVGFNDEVSFHMWQFDPIAF